MTSIAERHKYILESLAKNGFIKVNEIAKELEVTPVTIRKDLKHLEEKKLLYRTHGSASPVNPLTSDIDVHEKEKLRKEEKKRIATAAAKLIEENDSIIIASGSTVHTFSEVMMKGRSPCFWRSVIITLTIFVCIPVKSVGKQCRILC